MNLPSYIKSITNPPPEVEAEIMANIKRQELPKGDFLYKQGDICRDIFYIEKGLARVYYYANNGKEISTWFSLENSFNTAIDGFYHHKPTIYNCKLLENSVVYSMKYSDFDKLMNKYTEFSKFAFNVMHTIAKQMADFITNTKFQTAEKRFNALMQDYPFIFQRVSLVHIASYLGITKETLSRIRAGK